MTAFPNFFIFAIGQWIGVSIFYSLACYFTLAIDSFRIFPEYLTRKYAFLIAVFVFVTPVLIFRIHTFFTFLSFLYSFFSLSFVLLTVSRIIACFIVYYLPFVAVFAVLLYNHEKPGKDRSGCKGID
jgi:hypothetical protein